MAQSFNTNLGNVAMQYIQRLNVPVTKTSLKESLEQNPYYPSLYSLSNTFEKFGIANQAFTVDEAQFEQFEPPFITYCSGQSTGKDFVLVTQLNNNTVTYIAENNKPKQISKQDFLKQWQKLVFIGEANTVSGEKDYYTKVKIEKVNQQKQFLLYTGVATLIGLLVYWLISSSNNSFTAAGLAITKLLGVTVTVLLLIYEIDKTNSFVKNICTAGKKLNCDAVINSKAGRIFGMSWAEAGFFYFAATTLFLLWPGLAFNGKIPWLAISSTVAAAYMPFSIYYQWRVVKQWCPLCLATQAILAVELIWALTNFWASSPTSMMSSTYSFSIGITIWAILFPIVAWYLLKPMLLSAKNATAHKAAYKRLLYNPEIFNSLLLQQATVPDGWQNLGIDIGNPNAPNTIIKVCNPYCGPCAKAHPVLEEIVKHNSNVNVKVIFTATNAETDRAGKPVKHLLAIAAKQNIHETEKALDEWYRADKKDYELFAAKYPMNGELKQQENKIEDMKNWCHDAEITATPTIFINGRRLPETYSIQELKNIF